MNESRKKAQMKRTYEAFQEKPKTMKMVSVETGIMRPSICRYVATLRRQEKIALVKEDECPITGHDAQYLTTDADMVRKIHSRKVAEV